MKKQDTALMAMDQTIKMQYPTKETILAQTPIINPKTIAITNIWKKEALPNWNKDSQFTKFCKLQMLIICISETEDKREPIIRLANTNALFRKNIILLDIEKLSIISTLHEIAHYLFGPSELTACRWSIHLFKTCFPKQFEKLDWKGHLLIKQ